MTNHFGIGTATSIDKIIVTWPSGIVDEINNPSINSTITIVEGQSLGTNDFEVSDSIVVYPNPASDYVTLKGNILSNSDNTVVIYDTLGRIVYNASFRSADTIVVPVAELEDGVYYIWVNGRKKKIIKKKK